MLGAPQSVKIVRCIARTSGKVVRDTFSSDGANAPQQRSRRVSGRTLDRRQKVAIGGGKPVEIVEQIQGRPTMASSSIARSRRRLTIICDAREIALAEVELASSLPAAGPLQRFRPQRWESSSSWPGRIRVDDFSKCFIAVALGRPSLPRTS